MISRAFVRASASGRVKLVRAVASDILSARSRGRISRSSNGCRCWIPKTVKVNGLLLVLPDDHMLDDSRKTGHLSLCAELNGRVTSRCSRRQPRALLPIKPRAGCSDRPSSDEEELWQRQAATGFRRTHFDSYLRTVISTRWRIGDGMAVPKLQ